MIFIARKIKIIEVQHSADPLPHVKVVNRDVTGLYGK